MSTLIHRTAAALLCLLSLALVAGCGGGGGGGGGSATVTGRILLVSTAQPPDPVATVTISGRSTTTGTDGTFVLQNVPSNATSVVISEQGSQTLTQVLPALASGTTPTDLGDVFLSADGYTSSVTGRVVSANTLAAIPGADVRINGQRRTSGTDGTFAFSNLPVGLGRGSAQIGVISGIKVVFPDNTEVTFDSKNLVLDLELDAGANDLGNILMSPRVDTIPGGPYTITSTVTLQGLTDATDTEVALVDAGGSVIGDMFTKADGVFGFWVGKGNYTLRFSPPPSTSYQLKIVPVTVTSITATQTVNVTLTP